MGVKIGMGHERVGFLPKSKPWRDVVKQIAGLYVSDIEVSDIVRQTTMNVRSRLSNLHNDEGVLAAFKFLVALSVFSRSKEPRNDLISLDIKLPENFTPLSLSKVFNAWMGIPNGSLEYSQIARSATIDVIGIWSEKNRLQQQQLFSLEDDPFDVWRKAGNGAGFCEVARLFFAKFTERYLNYFLEREASANLSINEREDFHYKIQEHVDEISCHAFETTKIAQSFAAGWFNKHAREKMPTENEMRGFLAHSFGKIRDELRREGEAT